MSSESKKQKLNADAMGEKLEITQPDDGTGKRTDPMVGALQLDAKNSTTSLIVHQERLERHALKTETHSGANATIERWSASYASREKKKTVPATPTEREAPNMNQLTADALIGTSLASVSTTPLEDMRRKSGLDQERKDIYTKLEKMCGLQKGIEMIEKWSWKNRGKHCENMAKIRQIFPHLAATEIAMLPLLEKIPETFLLNGTNFESLAVKRKIYPTFGEEEDLRQEDLNEVPSQLEMRVDGIAYGTETTNLYQVLEDDETSQVNVSDREIVPYTDEAREMIERLILLSIEMPRLFERLQKDMTDALQVGVGMIQKEAVERMRSEGSSSPVQAEANGADLATIIPEHATPREVLSNILREMAPDENARRVEEEQAIADRLIETHVSREGESRMSLQEIIYMIGLLKDIPRSFLLTPPFCGSIRFHGTQLLIADEKGAIVEVCPLSPECARTMRQTIYDESVESTDRNRTMLEIGEQLTTIAQTQIFGKFANGEQTIDELAPSISSMEELSLRIQKNIGINLAVLGEGTLKKLQPIETDEKRTIVGGMIINRGLKMGMEETQQIYDVKAKRKAHVKATHFMEKAAQISANNMGETFRIEADRFFTRMQARKAFPAIKS